MEMFWTITGKRTQSKMLNREIKIRERNGDVPGISTIKRVMQSDVSSCHQSSMPELHTLAKMKRNAYRLT